MRRPALLGLLAVAAAAAPAKGCSERGCSDQVQGVVMLQTTAQMGRRHTKRERTQNTGGDGALQQTVASQGQAAGRACTDDEGHPLIVGSCFTTYYTLALGLLALLSLSLAGYVVAQRRSAQRTEAKLRAYRSKLRSDKRTPKEHGRLSRDCEDIMKGAKGPWPGSIADRAFTQDAHGSTTIMLKPDARIDFQEPNFGSYPHARLAHAAQAQKVFGDIADFLAQCPSLCVLVEGHTPSAGNSPLTFESLEYAHELAFNRAELVRADLAARGVGEERLGAIGIPGKLGDDESKIVFRVVDVN